MIIVVIEPVKFDMYMYTNTSMAAPRMMNLMVVFQLVCHFWWQYLAELVMQVTLFCFLDIYVQSILCYLNLFVLILRGVHIAIPLAHYNFCIPLVLAVAYECFIKSHQHQEQWVAAG